MADTAISAVEPPWGGATVLKESVVVARAVRNKSWIRGAIQTTAFLRRDNDIDGLTVTNAGACTSEELCNTLTSCFGALNLTVGDVRALNEGLDVIPDSLPHPCHHATIRDLPFPLRSKEEQAEAEYLAGLLAEVAWLDEPEEFYPVV